MQNLKLLRQVNCLVDLPPPPASEAVETETRVAFVTHDSDSGHLYAITNNCHVIGVKPLTNEVAFELTLDQKGTIIAAQYVPDLQSVCLATLEGDIILIDTDAQKEDCVGTIENGIAAMAWSPDYEIVVFVTRANTLLLMTQDWEPIVEQPLIANNPEQFAKTKFDSSAPRISWRGDGQFFAVSSVEDGVTLFRIFERSGKPHSKSEDLRGSVQSPVLSWKPSGELIASSSRHPSGKHEIIFFERNGLRHGEFALRDPSATVVDIKWNASSEVLAVLLEIPSKPEISAPVSRIIQFWYTKNYHWYLKQQIDNFQTESVPAWMEWDSERPMLIHVGCQGGQISSLEFSFTVDISLGSHSTNESVLSVIDGSSLYLTPTRRVVPPPPMRSTEISIAPDRISCLDHSPRTSHLAVKHSGAKISVFEPYAANIQPGKPPVFNVAPKLRATFDLDAQLAGLRSIQFVDHHHVVGVISSEEGDELVCVTLDFDSQPNPIARMSSRLNVSSRGKRVLVLVQNKDTHSIFLEMDNGSVSHVVVDAHGQLSTRKFVGLSEDGKLPAACPWLYSAVFRGSSHHGISSDVADLDDEEQLIGLSERSKLYVNSTLISQECNSFHVHAEFVLFTTVSHTLRFMNVNRTIEENIKILNDAAAAAAATKAAAAAKRSTSKGGGASFAGGNWNDSIREVEQGSILVSVVPCETRVVLQMPRGNLEVIEPRALVVSKIRSSMDALEYGNAFTLMRKHRIDLNLLYDHNPSKLMENLDLFVKQVGDVDNLNLFISSLRREDVTRTIFVDLWRDPNKKESPEEVIKRKLRTLKLGKPPASSEQKVSYVCDALRLVFQKLHSSKYLLPILTTYVLREPPQVEEALKLIQQLRAQEAAGSDLSLVATSSGSAASISAEKALKYLIFLVDVNTLYDITLGTYDLDLVLAVAQRSQKDPREYLPFLAELQKQDKFIQRFNIDVHLKRFDRALESISQAEPQEEHFGAKVLPLVQERQLYPKAIEIYSSHPNKSFLSQLYEIYGDYLKSQQHYGQAAMCWRASGKPELVPRALDAYKLHGDWRAALTCAHELNWAPDAVTSLARDLASDLASRFKFDDAALIYESYVHDIDEALNALVQGQNWEAALLLCARHNLGAKRIDEVIKPAILEACDNYLLEFAATIVKFTKYHNRLVVVRANKYIQSQQLPNAPSASEIEGSETGSIYSSGSGSESSESGAGDDAASRRSGASGRGRRGGARGGRGGKKPRNRFHQSADPAAAQGKKKLTGRKGSPHEEEFLMMEMTGMLPTMKLQDDIRLLLRQLVVMGQRDRALALQRRFAEWLDIAQRALPILTTLTPLTREELEQEEVVKKTRDELLNAVIHPVTSLPSVAPHVLLPRSTWELSLLK